MATKISTDLRRALNVVGATSVSLRESINAYVLELQTANADMAQALADIRAERASLLETNTELGEANVEVRRNLGQSEAACKELAEQLQRARDKVTTLKDVARFYRAQRDRVNGYLSGVLDTVNDQKTEPERVDFVRSMSGQESQGPAPRRLATNENRPYLREPSMPGEATLSRNEQSDGFADYRDSEPRHWEDL